jgi:hypothetical protein
MQQFDITVASTGAFPVHAAGRYIKYLAGNNGGGDTSLVVTPGGQGGSKIVLQPGQAYRVAPDRPTPDSWTLANSAGGAPIIGKVVIGDGRIDDNTFSGVVQTVDGGKARTLNNTAFIAGAPSGSASGQFGELLLWNPAASGKRMVIEALSALGQDSIGALLFEPVNSQLITTLAQYGQPKLFGGSPSVAGVYKGNTGVTLPAASTIFILGGIGGGNTQGVMKLVEPWIIPPGWGLLVQGNVVGAGISAYFEWYEEPNV